MADGFANDPIPVDALPQLDEGAFVPVDPRHVGGSLAATCVLFVVVLAVAAVWAANVDAAVGPLVFASVAGLLLVAAGAMTWLGARRRAYLLRDHDLSLRSGVVTRTVETIPFTRVQHVSVGRGVIERSLGLATLTVSSAGPDIAVPGLTPHDAERIKHWVAARAGVDDEADSSGAPLPPPALAPPPPPSATP